MEEICIMKRNEELKYIRNALTFSIPQFARLVAYRSPMMVRLYEKGAYDIPDDVLERARLWLAFYERQLDTKGERLTLN